jgi:hypothetical protein
MFRKQFIVEQDAWVLAQAIVDTVREPLIVLDQDLRVVAASHSFYLRFKVDSETTLGKLLYDLGDGQWDIPKLRVLLGKIIPEKGTMEDYEVEHDFPGLGARTMLLNARKVFYAAGGPTTILLGIEDVTDKRVLENEKDELIRQKQILLEELEHRVANSLQIIASIIMLKARGSRVRGNPPASARRSQSGHFRCRGSKTFARLGGQRGCRYGSISYDSLQSAGAIDDQRQSAGFNQS